MIGLSGLLVAAAVVPWVIVVAFWSRRWSVWAVAAFSIIAFYLWKTAIEAGQVELAAWGGGIACVLGIVAIVALARRSAQ